MKLVDALLVAAVALSASACRAANDPGAAWRAKPSTFANAELRVAAEGPCARLSVRALGDQRVLVFGDTGYDLAGWLPGDQVPAAQSLVLLTPGGAARAPDLLRGLPRDSRGYVPGDLDLGGHGGTRWLLRVTTRYAPGGGGVLFARTSEGYQLDAGGWRRAPSNPVERPAATARLPELPPNACGERTFIPLASATTERGVVLAGRCDDERVANPSEVELMVAHGLPGAASWRVERVPGTENLDGIVNVDLDARTDDDVALVAWEPFVPLERRQGFAARWNGRAWSKLSIDAAGGLVGVAHHGGALVVLDGHRALRVDAAGRATPIALPPPRFARGAPADIAPHAVHAWGDELWIEARHRVWLERDRLAVWASVLFTTATVPRTVYCDAREPAESAVTEVE